MDRSSPSSSEVIPDEQRLSLRMLRVVNNCFAHGFHRLDVLSPCPLPRSGPAILVCNHISGLDPVLIQSVTPRLIVWMMAREYYDQPGLGWAFRHLKAIAVDRSGRDLHATRQAFRALANGNILGVFPEGKIELARQILPFQSGVAMMAMRTGLDVFPAALEGTSRGKTMLRTYLESQYVRLSFGPKVDLNTDTGAKMPLEMATNVLEQAVTRQWQHLNLPPLGSI